MTENAVSTSIIHADGVEVTNKSGPEYNKTPTLMLSALMSKANTSTIRLTCWLTDTDLSCVSSKKNKTTTLLTSHGRPLAVGRTVVNVGVGKGVPVGCELKVGVGVVVGTTPVDIGSVEAGITVADTVDTGNVAVLILGVDIDEDGLILVVVSVALVVVACVVVAVEGAAVGEAD